MAHQDYGHFADPNLKGALVHVPETGADEQLWWWRGVPLP